MLADPSLCDPFQVALMAANISLLLLFGRHTLSPSLSIVSGGHDPILLLHLYAIPFQLLSQQHQHQKDLGIEQLSKPISSIPAQSSVMLGT